MTDWASEYSDFSRVLNTASSVLAHRKMEIYGPDDNTDRSILED
jgi:hypothetical protein